MNETLYTVEDLIKVLKKFKQDAKVEVLIEHDNVQYQFNLNDIAYSPRQNTVVLMHEAFDGSKT